MANDIHINYGGGYPYYEDIPNIEKDIPKLGRGGGILSMEKIIPGPFSEIGYH